MSTNRDQCQIFLVIDAADGSNDRLLAALSASRVASVLIRTNKSSTKPSEIFSQLVRTAQDQGVAALIENDPALAIRLRADGVHLTAAPDLLELYRNARTTLGATAIVGLDCGGSRHLAMEAGEAGADYIAFSKTRVTLPQPSDEDLAIDPAPELSTTELVQWWSEIFEVPCVALDADSEADQLQYIEAGADFLGTAIPAGQSPHAVADLLRSTADRLARTMTRS